MTTPFVIIIESQIKALPAWLAGLGCNSCSHDGGHKISVGRTRGRKYSYVASVIVKKPVLFDAALDAVKETVFGKATS